MPKLSVGVIGAGSIGNVHLTGYAADPKNVRITAISEINPDRLTEMGKKFRVPAEKRYRDYKKMIANEQLDTASVCLPNYLHFDAAAEAIKAGLNVLVEKPMVLSMDEARQLRQLLKKNPGKFMVAFSHRFFLANVAAKKLIAKGVIGKPFMIRVRYAHTGPYPGWAQTDWFYNKKKAGGGAMLDMGIHAIDMSQYLIGPVESVQAQIKTLRKNIQVDDNAVILLDFGKEAACMGYIEVGWTSPSGFAGIEVFGDKGSIRLELGKEGIINRGVTRPDGTIERKEEVIQGYNALNHWPLQMESFIKHCLNRKTVTEVPGIEEGQSSLAVAVAAVESSESGKRVKVKRLK